jgi:glucan biosynthesis protein C
LVNSRIGSRRRWRLAEGERPNRIVAFDYLRGFIIVLVVLHHSVLAYCRFGHFDRRHYLWSTAPIVDDMKWSGFDLIVLFNDGYFMALLFLLSGLFVWPSLRRMGGVAYGRHRLLRLGLPFAVAVTTIIPLAYYPSFRMTDADLDFGSFWLRTVFIGPWPSGPPWFLCVLLGFDLTAALSYEIARRWPSVDLPRPLACLGVLLALSALAYLPLLLLFGPARWFSFGPFAIQASRVGLYGVYFLAGVVAGHLGLKRLLAGVGRVLPRRWVAWSLLAVLSFAAVVALQLARSRGWPPPPAWRWLGIYGCGFVLFSASATFAWFAVLLRFGQRPVGIFDSLATNAFGIYLLHYPIVIWTQYALLDLSLGPVAKATLVFTVALALTWGMTMMLRRVPGVARVI